MESGIKDDCHRSTLKQGNGLDDNAPLRLTFLIKMSEF